MHQLGAPIHYVKSQYLTPRTKFEADKDGNRSLAKCPLRSNTLFTLVNSRLEFLIDRREANLPNNSMVHEIVHLDWKLLLTGIFMCIEIMIKVHGVKHSVHIKISLTSNFKSKCTTSWTM